MFLTFAAIAGFWVDVSLCFLLNTFLEHHKGERRTYPAAHPSLTKKQEVAWRRLQTNTYPNPGLYRHFHPDIHDGKCKHCPEIASLTHMLWECPSVQKKDFSNTKGTFIITSKEQWETVLHSENPDIQQWAVQRAEDAARSQDILAVV